MKKNIAKVEGIELWPTPFLSVVVAVRNEANFIENVLTQISSQNYPKDNFEIIVADGLSTDTTPLLVQKFSATNPYINISLLQNKKMVASAGRNVAIRHAQGDYVVIIDGHVNIEDRNLFNHIATISKRENARVLGRPQPLISPRSSAFQLAVGIARSSPLAHSQESYIYSEMDCWVSPLSVGVIYHRSIFKEFGYFDESFDAAEDVEFNYRLEKKGIDCYLSQKLKVNYYPRKTIRRLFDQMHRYGLGRMRFVMKHPERFTIETIIPGLFVLSWLTFFLAALLFTAVIPVYSLLTTHSYLPFGANL